MKKSRKRLPSLALALLLLLSLLPGGALAAGAVASGECGANGGNVTWSLDSAGVLTISGSGAMQDFDNGSLPWGTPGVKKIVISRGVTRIGARAFQSWHSLTTVEIADTVTEIGERAFFNASSLKNPVIPGSVQSIGDYAFAYCFYQDTTVTLQNGIQNIGSYAFSGNSGLKSITIPESVTSIGTQAFSGTGLTAVTIPAGVTQIGNGAFSSCGSLTGITAASDSDYFFSSEGVLFSGDGATLVAYPGGKEGAYSIPEGVVELQLSAFSGCTGLTSVRIPSTAVLDEWNIHFSACSNLTEITVDPGNSCVRSINGVVFNKDGAVIRIYPCGRQGAYTIPDGVRIIRSQAFFRCTGLTDLTIPDTVTNVETAAFFGCTGLKNLTFPDSVINIGAQVCYQCSGLETVSIPARTSYIGYGAFADCAALAEITVAEDNAWYCTVDGVLFDMDMETLLTCPAAKKGAYTIPGSVTSIEAYAFNYSGLSSITIPRSVTSIGYYAFAHSSLTGITIPDSVTSIGSSAFYYCSGLQSITIPGSVAEIESSTFYYCPNLTSVVISEGVTAVESSAFYYCAGITSISIPASMLRIGAGAFHTLSLKDIYYASNESDWNAIDFGVIWDPDILPINLHFEGPAAPLVVNFLKANKTAAYTDESVTWTASASGGSGTLQYCFYIFRDGSVVFRGDYGTGKTCSYTPTAAGTYTARVYVKDGSGASVSLDGAAVTVSANTEPLTIGGVTPSKTSANMGTPITWTASASGGSGTLQYCFYIFRDGSVVFRGDYGTGKTCSYTPAAAGSYTVRLYVKDSAGATATLDNAGAVTIAAPITISGVTPGNSSVNMGSAITWTASVSGGSGTLQYCFYVFRDGSVVSRGNYSKWNICIYMPGAAGTYTVRLYVKDETGTVKTLDNTGAVTVTDPLTIGGVTPNRTSANAGTAITWTASASGGSGTLQYCFYVFRDGSVVSRGSYGTGKTCSYTPTAAGSYTVRLYVKDSAGTVKTLDNAGAVAVTAPITISGVTPNRTSANTGTAITWTASASGGSGTLQYCFYVFRDGSVVYRGSYGTGKTCSYTPTAAGSYTVRLYVKDSAGTVKTLDNAGKVTVTAAAAPITISGVTVSPTSANTGTKLTWTASATGGSGTLQYCFYVFKDGSVVYRGSYGTGKTCSYTPTAAGSYTVRLYVKDSAGTVKTLDNAGAVTVTAPITIVRVTADKSNTTTGRKITWTASATGGSGTLQYCFYVFKDGSVVYRGSYGTGTTCAYTPTAAGTYTVRLYVKDAAGTTATLDNAGKVTVS